MDEHVNNSNTTENTDKQPYNNYDYSDEEYERMRIEMEKRRAERPQDCGTCAGKTRG